MTPAMRIFHTEVPSGRAVALTLVNATEEDEYQVLYAPDPAERVFSPYMENGKAVLLTSVTSPVILAVPGVYTVSPNGDPSEHSEVQVSDTPFTITLTKAIP